MRWRNQLWILCMKNEDEGGNVRHLSFDLSPSKSSPWEKDFHVGSIFGKLSLKTQVGGGKIQVGNRGREPEKGRKTI